MYILFALGVQGVFQPLYKDILFDADVYYSFVL